MKLRLLSLSVARKRVLVNIGHNCLNCITGAPMLYLPYFMARSLNCVQLIGNLTRDPELRYTQGGKPVCDIGLATNRQWKTEAVSRKRTLSFTNWCSGANLAEISSQYLKKGAKAYFQGRLTTRAWTAQDGTQKNTTEIIVEEMIMLSGEPRTGERAAAPVASYPTLYRRVHPHSSWRAHPHRLRKGLRLMPTRFHFSLSSSPWLNHFFVHFALAYSVAEVSSSAHNNSMVTFSN